MKRNAAQIHLDNISRLEFISRFFFCPILYCSWRIQRKKNDIHSICVDAVNSSITSRDLDVPFSINDLAKLHFSSFYKLE